MIDPTAPVLILGVGNRFRRDDGVGPVVAERLRPRGFEAREHSGEGASLIEAFADCGHVLIVDAARSGVPAGTVHHFDAHAAALPSGFFHYSTHLFSVAEAIEMARALGRLPPRLDVWGIEGAEFGFGEGLSEAVARAADLVVARIVAEFGGGRPTDG